MRVFVLNPVYAVYAISSPDTDGTQRHDTGRALWGFVEEQQPVAGSLSRPSRWSKRRKKRFAVDGEEGPQGLIVRQDELEDAPDDQLPPRVGERRGS